MRILLVRPKNYRFLGVLEFVNVEPLELEYIASICNEDGTEYEIYDGSIDKRKFEDKYNEFDFDAVALSGYINSVDNIKKYAEYIKSKNKNVKVIAGGVVAEVVPELLYSPYIDVIVHSGGFQPFKELLRCGFNEGMYKSISGICCKDKGRWIKNKACSFDINSLTVPDRSHFCMNSGRFRYLNYKPVAIMKTSYSCPYNCNFCYCRKLNGGSFVNMDIARIAGEIKSIQCDNIWIVDDVFLLDRQRVLSFAETVKKECIKKNFIVYSRADFIAYNRDILPLLKEAGVVMVIVGLEAADDDNLRDLNKHTDEDMNWKCVKYLDESNIECTGLFIADIDFTRQDFRKLRHWIKQSNLKTYTVSILTPLPGTELYEKYRDRMTDGNYSRYDFLHLHMEPLHMSRKAFYFEFLKLHIPLVTAFIKEKLFS